MTPCYYCELDDEWCKRCIHDYSGCANVDALLAALKVALQSIAVCGLPDDLALARAAIDNAEGKQ